LLGRGIRGIAEVQGDDRAIRRPGGFQELPEVRVAIVAPGWPPGLDSGLPEVPDDPVLPARPDDLIDRVLTELIEDVLVVPEDADEERTELVPLGRAESPQIGLAPDEQIGDGRKRDAGLSEWGRFADS